MTKVKAIGRKTLRIDRDKYSHEVLIYGRRGESCYFSVWEPDTKKEVNDHLKELRAVVDALEDQIEWLLNYEVR